ncbi:hypothetical protein ACSHWB_44990 [Lentzea sp. HUAS TT2]|uniref:hypothetical protein n=1 Tax=Lentzea sp. HUAS TT2 TaxID=3447454 RepID=UPI003F730C31
MNGPVRGTPSARAHLARLVVVLAVLAGLALVVGAQCTDGMSMAHDVNVVMTDGGHEAVVERPVAAGEPAALARDMAGGSDMGGVLAVCLMIIAAVVSIVAVLRLPGVRGLATVVRPACATLAAAFLPQAPSLAKLCLLRI